MILPPIDIMVFKKSKCFAVSMFDERIFPYSPQGGIQVFQRALALATT